MSRRPREAAAFLLAVLAVCALTGWRGRAFAEDGAGGAAISLTIAAPAPLERVGPRPAVVVTAPGGWLGESAGLELLVDGTPVLADAVIGEATAILRPRSALSSGTHDVAVRAGGLVSPPVRIVVTGGAKNGRSPGGAFDGVVGVTAVVDAKGAGISLPFAVGWGSRPGESLRGFVEGKVRLPLLSQGGSAGDIEARIDRFEVERRSLDRIAFVGDRSFKAEHALFFGEATLRGSGVLPEPGRSGGLVFHGTDPTGTSLSVAGWRDMDGPAEQVLLFAIYGEAPRVAWKRSGGFGRWNHTVEGAGAVGTGAGIEAHALGFHAWRGGYPIWRIEGRWVGDAFHGVNGAASPGTHFGVERVAPVTFSATAAIEGSRRAWRMAWSGAAFAPAFVEAGLEKPASFEAWAPFAHVFFSRSFAAWTVSLETRLWGWKSGAFEREGTVALETEADAWRMGARSWAKAKGDALLIQTEAGAKAYAGRDLGRLGEIRVEAETTRRASASLSSVALEASALTAKWTQSWGGNSLELSVTERASLGSGPAWSARLEVLWEI